MTAITLITLLTIVHGRNQQLLRLIEIAREPKTIFMTMQTMSLRMISLGYSALEPAVYSATSQGYLPMGFSSAKITDSNQWHPG